MAEHGRMGDDRIRSVADEEVNFTVCFVIAFPYYAGSGMLSPVCFCHRSICFRSLACTAAYRG